MRHLLVACAALSAAAEHNPPTTATTPHADAKPHTPATTTNSRSPVLLLAKPSVAKAATAPPPHNEHSLALANAPPFVLTCAFFAALDALLLGYDIGVVSGILHFVQAEFSLSTHQTEIFASAINAAAIVGALSSGYLADKSGRKSALFLSSFVFTTGSFMMALAPTYPRLLFGRVLQGYGVGAGLLIAPMFISEIAPPAYRGSLVTLSEVSLSLGVLLAYMANFALATVPGQWRWMLALGAFPGILLTLRILFLPESPRWLVAHGQPEQAAAVLSRTLPAESKRERADVLRAITRRIAVEKAVGWLDFIRRRSTLVSLSVGLVVACLQHAVGIESIIYYSPIIFRKAGVSSTRLAILGTVAMGLVKLIFETYALLNIDKIGRRPLLLYGSAGLTLALLGIGVSLKAAVNSAGVVTPATYAVFGCMLAYMALHAISFGPVTWLLLSEILPSSIRGKAMGIVTTVNRGTSFVVAFTFLSLCERLQWSGSFYLYATVSAFAFFFYALFVPETTGLQLEYIGELFEHPRELVRHNMASLPYVGKRLVGTHSGGRVRRAKG